MNVKRLLSEKRADIIQFIKFGFVGVSNTLISYGIEMLCFYVLFVNTRFSGMVSFLNGTGISASGETVKIILTSAIAFIVSVTNSYLLNNRFVFGTGAKTFGEHIASYLKTVLCYGVTGLILAPIIKVLLNNAGMPYWAAALLSLIITVPLNFLLNKFWAFAVKKRK